MDLDDFDGPSKAPSRATRFAPKNSKFKSKPKTEPPQSQDCDSKPPTINSGVTVKAENEPSHVSSPAAENGTIKMDIEAANGTVKMDIETANGTVKMDIEAKVEEPKEDLMKEDNAEEEDHVVREIDVFFTPSVDSNTQLFVLQYPLKPRWRPYELDERCEEVRVKPETAEVEIDLSVDTDSKNYDPDADNRVRLTKQILSSSWKPPRRSVYAVGVLIGNKLHLNPIHAVVQLRPSMQHLRSGGSRKKSMANHVEDVKSKELKEEKSVGPSRKQSKPPGELDDSCEDYGENWVPLKYHDSRSDISSRYLDKMTAQEDSHIQFLMSASDYVNFLCPGTLNHARPRGPSRRYLLSLPLEDRYKSWLLEGPPIHRFDALKHLAPSDSVADVLEVIKKFACLVQGLWVPKSSLLYSQSEGLQSLARDYTLYLFSKSRVISSKEIPQKKPFPIVMKEFLNVFAVERRDFHDWKFREPQDMSFVKHHPDIVKEQEQVWEHKANKLYSGIYGEGRGPGSKNSSKTNVANMVDKSITMKDSNKCRPNTSNVTPSRPSISDETREALLKALQKVFQTQSVCSFQKICQLLGDTVTSKANQPRGAKQLINAASSLDAPPDELRVIMNQVAIDIHGVFVSKSSPHHSQYDGLRKIVINLLIVEGPNAKLKRAAIMEAAKMELKREIPSSEYEKVMRELCDSDGTAWVLKDGDNLKK